MTVIISSNIVEIWALWFTEMAVCVF